MTSKFLAAALAGTTILALSLAPLPAEAGKRKVSRSSTGYSYNSGPRTRIYVSRRSWLDAGTEVRPGERKFSDYALPPTTFSRYPLDSNSTYGGYPDIGPFHLR